MAYQVHGVASSRNCYKVRLALEQLRRSYVWHEVEVDVMNGATRTEAFRQLNPNGKVPVLQIDGHTCLFESDAILFTSPKAPRCCPRTVFRGRVSCNGFFEQYSHEPNIAVARFILQFVKHPDDPRLPEKTTGSYRALDVMETHLATRTYCIGEQYTIADIALYAYTHVADEANLDLGRYPAIRAWRLVRVKAQPRHIEMPGVDV